MKPGAGQTLPDEVPPVHVLQAAHHQERKETEDLLAGFDVPGRGPKKPAAERDFVDYYTKKKGDRSSAAPTGSRRDDVLTVVRPRHDPARRAPAGWVTWLGLAVLMLGIGGLVAFLATEEPGVRAAGSGAATITAASPPALESNRDAIPPPDPVAPAELAPTTVTSEPAAPRTRAYVSGATSSEIPATSGVRKPPPRDDFIRDM